MVTGLADVIALPWAPPSPPVRQAQTALRAVAHRPPVQHWNAQSRGDVQMSDSKGS